MALFLFEQFLPLSQKIRLVGIGLSGFDSKATQQLSLFDAPPKETALNAGVDQIVAKFGKGSIQKASLLDHPTDPAGGFSSFLKK